MITDVSKVLFESTKLNTSRAAHELSEPRGQLQDVFKIAIWICTSSTSRAAHELSEPRGQLEDVLKIAIWIYEIEYISKLPTNTASRGVNCKMYSKSQF
jgi:hypothetical protein